MDQAPDALQREELPGVAKGAAFTLVFQFLDKVFGFVFAVLAPRLIGLASFGIYNICVSIAHLSSTISLAGLTQGLIRDGSIHQDRHEWGRFRGLLRFTVRFGALSSLTLATLIIVFSRPLAQAFLHDESASWTLWLAALSIPFSALTLIMVQLSTSLRVVRHNAIVKNFFESSLKIVFFLGLFGLGLTLGAVVGGYTLTMVACFFIATRLLRRLVRKLPAAPAVPCDGRALLAYSFPLLGPLLFTNMMVWVDILLLGYFAENAVVGLFALALKIMLIAEVIPRSFSAPASPRLASMLKAGRREQWQPFYRRISRWVFGLTLPFYLFFIMRSDLTLTILGPQFTAGAMFLSILSIGPMFFALVGPADTMLAMGGHSRLQLINTLGAFAVNLIANLVFLPRFGAPAMAWIISGTMLGYSLVLAVEIFLIYRFIPVSARVLRGVAAILPSLGIQYWLMMNPPLANARLEFLLEGTVFFGLYIIFLALIGTTAQDREVLTNMIRRIRDHYAEIRHPRQDGRFL